MFLSQRHIAFISFLFVFFGYQVSNITGVYSSRILLIIFLFILAIATIYLDDEDREHNYFLIFVIIVYAFLHSRSNYSYAGNFFISATNFMFLALSTLSVYLFSIPGKLNNRDVINSLYKGLTLSFFVVTFLPNNIWGSFEIGGHYNLGDQFSGARMPFIQTTVDSPLLTSIALLFSSLLIYFRLKSGSFIENIGKNTLLALVAFLSLLELFLMNRRGPIIAVFLAVLTVGSSKFLIKVRLLFLIPAFVIIPLFWIWIAPLLYDLLSSDLLNQIFTRVDPSNIETATGRIQYWAIAINHLIGFDLTSPYLLGVGNLPERELLGPYGHAHNSLLESLVQVGLIGTLIIYFLIYNCIRQFNYILKVSEDYVDKILLGIFSLLLFITATESIFTSNYFAHILILSIFIIVNNRYLFFRKIDKFDEIENI